MTLRSWLTKPKITRLRFFARFALRNPRLAEQRAANAKLEGKLDKLNIELIGVKGRVRKVEEALESIARVMSDGALG